MLEITNRDDLVKFFDTFTKPSKAVLTSRTLVKMNKKDVATKTIANPFGDVFKVQTIRIELNPNYEAKVNNERFLENKDTTFEVEDMKWGEHVNKAIVEHNGQRYLQTIELERITSAYQLANGTPIEYDAFAQFVPPKSYNKKQDVDNEVKVRTFKLDSVIGFHIRDVVRFVDIKW